MSFICSKFQLNQSKWSHFMAENGKVWNEEKTKKLFEILLYSYFRISWCDSIQTWYVDLNSSRASQQQIWLNSERDPRATEVWKVSSLSSFQYTHGVVQVLLGPHDTPPCVLIRNNKMVNTIKGLQLMINYPPLTILPMQSWCQKNLAEEEFKKILKFILTSTYS